MLKNRRARLGLAAALVLIVGYLFVLPRFQGAAAPPEIPEHPNPGPTYTLPAHVYNLQTPAAQPPTYLKLGVVLEFATEDPAFFLLAGEALTAALALFAEELGPKAPVIADTVGDIVGRKTLAEIAAPTGRERLKAELLAALRVQIGEPELLNVYFTEFVFQ